MTEQFISAEISGCALKQQNKTHSVLWQSSSQLQKYQTVWMSLSSTGSEAEKLCGHGQNSTHSGLLLTRSKLDKLHKNSECAWSTPENFNFYYVAVKYTTTGGQNRCGLLWSIMLHPGKLLINDEAWMCRGI